MSNPNKQCLQHQVALGTGASSGIGAGVAKTLAADGATVVVNYSSSSAGADQVVQKIKADVSQEDQVLAMYRRVFDQFGTLYILVNNAGLQKNAPFIDMSLAQWEYLLGTT